jgi:hypothetical protein
LQGVLLSQKDVAHEICGRSPETSCFAEQTL